MKYCIKVKGLMAFLALVICSSCKKTNDNDPGAFVSGYWTVDLTTTNKIPGDSVRKDHGYGLLTLMSDSSLAYDIYVAPLGSGDALTTAQLFLGSPAENGRPLVTLTGIRFTESNNAKGTIPVKRPVLDSLQLTSSPLYLVISSNQQQTGLLRGQLGKKIIYATDVTMNGAGFTPPVATSVSGLTVLRLLQDNVTLFYNVQVTGVPANDVLTSAAIRRVSDNSILVQLAGSAAGFNVPLSTTISATTAASIKADPLYIDVRSTLYPNGLIKGKIR